MIALMLGLAGISYAGDAMPARPLGPADAVTLVATEQELWAKALATDGASPIEVEAKLAQRRFIFCPDASKDEYDACAVICNQVLTRTEVDYKPEALALGRLVAVDLTILAPEHEDFLKLLKLWDSLAAKEPYFTANIIVPGRRHKVSVKPYRATDDGKTYDWKWEESKQTTVRAPAPHLGPAAYAMERTAGNLTPQESTVLPCVHVGWLTTILSSSSDDGLYYTFRGLEANKTKLKDYLKSRGASEEQATLTNTKEKAAMISRVTGKARAIIMFQAQGTRPSAGRSLIAITEDPFDDNVDPDSDAFRSLLEGKPNGKEVIVVLPNGWLEYTLWNADDILQKEAPPNLVADHRIPEPYTKRLQGMIACQRCHGPKGGWQPFDNEVAAMAAGNVRIFGDVKGGKDQGKVLRQLAALYTGELGDVVVEANEAYSKRSFAITGHNVDVMSAGYSNVFNHYNFDPITAKVALSDMGYALDPDDKLGVSTFKKIVPPLDVHGRVPDDPIIGRWHVTMFSNVTNARIGLTNTRRQWEKVFPDAALRAPRREQ